MIPVQPNKKALVYRYTDLFKIFNCSFSYAATIGLMRP